MSVEPIDVYLCVYNAPAEPELTWCHWVLSMHKPSTDEWRNLQVVYHDFRYRRWNWDGDPRSEDEFRTREIMGSISSEYWDDLPQLANRIRVPGNFDLWSPEDYVMELWETLYRLGATSEEVWAAGGQLLLTYYGPTLVLNNGTTMSEAGAEESELDLSGF